MAGPIMPKLVLVCPARPHHSHPHLVENAKGLGKAASMAQVKYHYGKFPPDNLDWEKLTPLIGPAHAAIAKYAGVLESTPNPDILLSTLLSEEAVQSNRIEGTQTTLSEVLEFETGARQKNTPENRKQDFQEVINYRLALQFADEKLNEIPLSNRLLKNAHNILMQNVRGQNKAPGEFRKIQNWIGAGSIENATYTTCSPEKLQDAMSEWEKYINNDAQDQLVQLAIAHAEFEAIHPFLDGNGRIGRLMIPLFLKSKNLLESPNFYISEYLENNREKYYAGLQSVSANNDWTNWCIFFLEALFEQAVTNKTRASKIIKLHAQKRDWIAQTTGSKYAAKALDWIFSTPIFLSSDFVKNAGIPDRTARRILNILKKEGFLQEAWAVGGRISAVLVYKELLDITEGTEA